MTALLAPFRSLAALDPTVVECSPDQGVIGSVLGRLHELDTSDVDWFVRRARLCRGPVADLMSGRGRVGRALAARGASVTCVDASPDVVADAAGSGPPFVLADVVAPDPPLARGSLAGAVCTGRSVSLLAPPDRRALFARAAELVAPGGWFLFDAFDRLDRRQQTPDPVFDVVPLAPVHDGLLWHACRVDADRGILTTNFLLESAGARHRLLAAQTHHGVAAEQLGDELSDAGFGRVRVDPATAPAAGLPGYLRVHART